MEEINYFEKVQLSRYCKEIEPTRNKELKQQENKFVDEFTMDNLEWVKQQKGGYLKQEFFRLKKEFLNDLEIFKKINKDHPLYNIIYEKLTDTGRAIRTISTNYLVLTGKLKLNNLNLITEEQIEEAKNADCSQFVEIKRVSGHNKFACCPFHNEKTPSLCCNKNRWKCFGCGEGGNAIGLIMKLHNLRFIEAVKFILENIN